MIRRTPESASNPNKKESKFRSRLAAGMLAVSALTMAGCSNNDGEIVAAPTGPVEQVDTTPELEVKTQLTQEEYDQYLPENYVPRETSVDMNEIRTDVLGEAEPIQIEGVADVTGYNEVMAAIAERSKTINSDYVQTLEDRVNNISLFNHFDSAEEVIDAAKEYAYEPYLLNARQSNIPLETVNARLSNQDADLTDQESYTVLAVGMFAQDLLPTGDPAVNPITDRLGVSDPEDNLNLLSQSVNAKLAEELMTGQRSTTTIEMRFVPDQELPADVREAALYEDEGNSAMIVTVEDGAAYEANVKSVVEITGPMSYSPNGMEATNRTDHVRITAFLTGEKGGKLAPQTASVEDFSM